MKVRTLRRLTNKLWATREAKCLAIAERALIMLRESNEAPETEVELNRLLYFYLLTASRELYPDEVVAPGSPSAIINQILTMKQGLYANKSDLIFNGFIWTATNRTLSAAVSSS